MKKMLCCAMVMAVMLGSCSRNASREQSSEAMMELLNQAYKQGEWETTLMYLDSLQKMNIGGNLLAIEAECYIGLGNYDKAIGILQSEIDSAEMENIHYLYNTLGVAYFYKGESDRAAEMYKKAIEFRPTYARPYIHLANLYEQSNNKEASISYFMDAVKLFAENEFYDEVVEFTSRVLDMDSTNIEALKFQQYALFTTGEYEYALSIGGYLDELLENAKQWNDRYVNWLFTGLSAFRCGEYELARDLIGNAMKSLEVAEVYGWLGHCYLSAIFTKQGNAVAAEAAMNAAKEIDKEGVGEFIEELVAYKVSEE